MTRKRYIKLLMSLDVQKRDAAAHAWWCRAWGVPYAEDWERMKGGRQYWLGMPEGGFCAGAYNGLATMERYNLSGARPALWP